VVSLHPSANNIIGFDLEAAGTEFAASPSGQAALATQFEGNRWMIIQNSVTGVQHWDFVGILQLGFLM
jgi:hypothetical protein